MTSGTVFVVGGSSDIGHAIALRYAQAGWQVTLSGRDSEALDRNVADIAARTSVAVRRVVLDILLVDQIEQVAADSPLPDTVICVVGEMGDQARAERDPRHAALVFRTNFEGPAQLLGLFAERFAQRGSGTLVGVSSVAGDRGRSVNYVYGSAKAGFTAFLSGLRNRLFKSGIRVVTIKPGFVRTRMTAGLSLPPRLTAEPAEVGEAVFRAAQMGRGEVVYVRPVWWLIMAVIGHIPEWLFKRLRLGAA